MLVPQCTWNEGCTEQAVDEKWPLCEEHRTEAKRLRKLKVAGWAEAHYIDIMPRNPLGPVCTAASIQLCAAVPNMAWLESHAGQYPDDAPEREIFEGVPQNSSGMFPVGDAPGLGITLKEDALKDEPFRYWEAPHLHRSDGSVTNW